MDDLSRDRTREILDEIVAAHPGLDLRVIRHEANRGRGATVTDGFRAARGEIAGYLDVDLEVHCRYIPSLVRAIEKGADVATLRRIYALQLRSLDRYFMSRGYSFLVRRLLGVPFRDTETGYKFFRRETRAPAARRDRGRGLVLGHGVHGARRAPRPHGRRGPGGLRPPRGQDLDGAGPARLGPLLPRPPPLPPPPAGRDRVKALGEIGWARAARFGFYTLAMVPYRLALVPQLRAPWLRLLGARIGRRTILHDVRFFNLYRRGLAGLEIGDECFVGDECLLDLAEGVRLESQVTLAERVLVLTHTNVGLPRPPAAGPLPGRGRARSSSRRARSWARA